MAKTKNALFSVEARGQVGDLVVENNRNTQYVRAKVKTKDPKTPKQKEQRKIYGEAVQAWRALTPEQKRTLNVEAHPLKISGFNLFIRDFTPPKEITIYGVGLYGVNVYG